MPVSRLLGLATLCATLSTAHAATLSGVTSKPTYSVFVRGEEITLTFTAEGLKAGQTDLSLRVTVSDVDGHALLDQTLPVAADAAGKWTGSLRAPSDRLGYYQVAARLSTGEELPAVGTRAAGFLTYIVVIDPQDRVQPGEDAHFGMQGGFTTAFDMRPYLGVRWVLSGYSWGREEPDHAGQFAEKRKLPPDQNALKEAAARETDHALGILPLPTLLNGTPKWALQGGKSVYTTGVIQDLDAWRNYCREVGRAAQVDYPWLKRHVFQITWEPVYPWGFPGSEEDLIRSYEVAFPALHETDPRAFVIGPTGAGISRGDLDWNERLLKKGLGKYLDGFSIHPYIAQPPEAHNLVSNVRALKEMIRTYVGRDLDLYGTEQGWPTGEDPNKEKAQALNLTRSYLIMLGEGFKVNIAFYSCDYPGEPGYGFFHNLVIKQQAWGPNSVSPKPMAATFAAMTMLLEGHKALGPIEWLGPTALGYACQREGKVTLVLWDYGDTPHAVKLPVGAESVEVYDWMGNPRTVAAPGGTLQLTLGPAPQYIRGVSAALWGEGAKRPLVIEPANAAAFPGETVRFTARVSATGGPLSGTLRLTPPEALETAPTETPIRLAAGEQATVPLDLRIPPDADFGALPVMATLLSAGRGGTEVPPAVGGETAGLATAMLRIKEPFTVERITPSGATGLALTLRNGRAAPTTGTAKVRLRGVPEATCELPFKLSPSRAVEVLAEFPALALDPARTYRAEVTLTDASGAVVTGAYRINFTTAPRLPASWADVPAIELKGRQFMVRQPQLYRGAADLSATFRYAWDEKALYLAADVTDDVFVQEKVGFNTWHDDCLQLAFDLASGKVTAGAGNLLAEAGSRTNTEIDLALTPKGPQAYRTITLDDKRLPVGLIPSTDLLLDIEKGPGGVRYTAALPWKTLGAEGPPASGVIGIAATVNDADDPKQLDPKALGLFGGITPRKDPAEFGQLVLTRQPAPAQTVRPAPALRFSAALGQSEPAGAPPIPWTGCSGAFTDDHGALWTLSDVLAFRFEAGRLRETVKLPTGMRAVRSAGSAMLCLGWDEKLYRFDPATKRATPLADLRSPDGKGPKDFAPGLKGDFYALGQDAVVRHWTPDARPDGDIARLTPGKDWPFCSVGVDPQTGDLLVGSYWPDCKLYRFTAAGKPLSVSESPIGYAALFTPLDGVAALLNVAGAAAPVPPAIGKRRPLAESFGYYPTGLAPDPAGGAWVACAQGLLAYDRKGHPAAHRLGGLADPGLVAVGGDGTVLTLVENSQRFARLSADDAPDAPLASNANEPWRVAAGWSGRAVGLAWDGDAYLVLDAPGKALWRFDPDHTAWAEKPWIRLTKEGALKAPRNLAVGDVFAFVLDGDSLLALSLADPEQPGQTVPLPAGLKPADIVALAAAGDDRLFLATATQVLTLDRTGRELWKATAPFTKITGLAASEDALFVADQGAKRVVSLDAATGKPQATLESGQVPGGFEPVGIAARSNWVFVSDIAGHRLLRVGASRK